MPSKRQTNKKRMDNVDSNSTNAGLKKKRTMKRCSCHYQRQHGETSG